MRAGRLRGKRALVTGAGSGIGREVARRFAAELERRFGLPVSMVDERWSSLEATAALKAQRSSGERKRRVTKEDIDRAISAVRQVLSTSP